MGLSHETFNALFLEVKREALHLSMRDSYGTEAELPYLAKWRAAASDDLGWLDEWAEMRSWCDLVREQVTAGRAFRRVNIVSEPLSEYQQWSRVAERPMVAAGQDIRWVPRRRVSELLFPGNDFWLFDDELVVFLHYTGWGTNVDFAPSRAPDLIQRCRSSFEAVWPLGVPLGQYHPAE